MSFAESPMGRSRCRPAKLSASRRMHALNLLRNNSIPLSISWGLFLRSRGWHDLLNKEIRALGILSKIWGEPSKRLSLPSPRPRPRWPVWRRNARLLRPRSTSSKPSAARCCWSTTATGKLRLSTRHPPPPSCASSRSRKPSPVWSPGSLAARTRRRQAEWEEIADEYFSGRRDLSCRHARDARQAFDAVTGIIGKAQNRGFAAEATSLFPFPIHLLDVELLKRLDVAVERAEAAAYAPPRPAAPPAAAAPAPGSPSMPAWESKPAALATVEILEPPVAVGGVPPGRPGQVKRGVPADVAWAWVRSASPSLWWARPRLSLRSRKPRRRARQSRPRRRRESRPRSPGRRRLRPPSLLHRPPYADGLVGIVVMRPGYPIPTGVSRRAGEQHRVSPEPSRCRC